MTTFRDSRIYGLYDALLTKLKLPAHYCSKCEKRIRFWIYRFKNLVYCQSCADEYVATHYKDPEGPKRYPI